jgi:thymidine kinase
VEVIAGVMFSGKSEELIRRVRRSIIARKKVQVFKSHLDARYSGIYSISSHDGRTVEAIPADSAAQISLQIALMAHVGSSTRRILDEGIVRW